VTNDSDRSRHVLVVCFGNLCRSPMAEGLLAARLGDDWMVSSAGTSAVAGEPPTDKGQQIMREDHGIDISGQRSAPLTVTAIENAAHILTMSIQQAQLVAALKPDAGDRLRLFGAFAPACAASERSADPGGAAASMLEVADPIGATLEDYRATANRLAQAADAIAKWLQEGADPNVAPASFKTPGWPLTLWR
jgi:protein-tyrosine phosphatase